MGKKNKQQLLIQKKFTPELPQKAADRPTSVSDIAAAALLYAQQNSQEWS